MGTDKIGDRDTWVVMARPQGDQIERLWFDQQSGLLVRRLKMNDSPLGALPIQDDSEDFREVNGVKIPFVIRRSRPEAVFTLKLSEVKFNAPLEDSVFARPAAEGPK